MGTPLGRLLIVKTGDTLDAVRASVGDFDAMFRRAVEGLVADVTVVPAHRDAPLPASGDFDATIVTGSPSSVTAREPWAERLGAWMAEAVAADRWLLGVCYGHQLLAAATGGAVERNPRGYEVGTIEVELTAEGEGDPLLGAIATGRRVLAFHSTHMDVVTALPRGARRLASTAMTEVQAFALGERAYGVQFHPEFDRPTIALYVEGRAGLIARDAEERGAPVASALERARRSVRDTPDGQALLEAFIRRAAGAAGDARGPRS